MAVARGSIQMTMRRLILLPLLAGIAVADTDAASSPARRRPAASHRRRRQGETTAASAMQVRCHKVKEPSAALR